MVPSIQAEYKLFLVVGISVVINYFNIDWLFTGNEEYGYIVIRSVAVKLASLLALFLFVRDIEDYITYAMITTFALSGNYLLNVLRAKKSVTLIYRGLNIKQHIKPVFILAGSLFLNAIYSKLDTTMLGGIAGEDSVGYYTYAHRILQVGITFCTAITSAFLPRLSYYYKNDHGAFRALVSKGIQIVAFLSIPAAAGLFILAPDVIRILFGDCFLPAARTLRIFSILIIVFAFGNLLSYQMMLCTGTEKKYVVILSVAAGLNVVLNSILIPGLKQDGAAIASVVTEIFINSVAILYYTKKLRVSYKNGVILQAILAAAIMSICTVVLRRLMGQSIFALICCICTGAMVYLLINVAMRNELAIDVIKRMRNEFRGKINQKHKV